MTHSNRGRLTVQLDGKWRLYSNTVPVGSVALGTVTRGEFEHGALVRFAATGLYAQVNAGVMRTLDQRKVSAAIDAAKPIAYTFTAG